MATISGNEFVGETLKRIGADIMFFIMGEPINGALTSALKKGIRGIDVRHEQAAIKNGKPALVNVSREDFSDRGQRLRRGSHV